MADRDQKSEVRSQKSEVRSIDSAYCLLPTAYCLLPTPTPYAFSASFTTWANLLSSTGF